MLGVTRLAPSPTGALHLGNARTFLVNWLLARQNGWKVILRIEDLDGPRVKRGADRQLIRKIFLAEGLVLAGIGAFFGILLAVALYFLQVNYKLVPLQGDSFLIDYYPVKLVWQDFLLVTVTVFAIGLLASWFPAYRASREPFELRN